MFLASPSVIIGTAHVFTKLFVNNGSSTIANTTTATVFTKTVPWFYGGYGLQPPNEAILLLRAGGRFSTTGSPNLQLKVGMDASGGGAFAPFFDTGQINAGAGITNGSWNVNLYLYMKRAGNIYLVLGEVSLGTTNNPATALGNQLPENSFTGPAATTDVFAVQAKWSAASPSNTITQNHISTQLAHSLPAQY